MKSAHLEYQIAYSFSTWFSPRGSLAISTRPKREFLFFRKKSNQKNRILKKSKIRVRVKGEINCRDWKIFNSYVPWGGKTLTQATPSAPDREELEKETIPDIKKATKWQRWDFIFLIKVIKNVITANFMKSDIFAKNLPKLQNFQFFRNWQVMTGSLNICSYDIFQCNMRICIKMS